MRTFGDAKPAQQPSGPCGVEDIYGLGATPVYSLTRQAALILHDGGTQIGIRVGQFAVVGLTAAENALVTRTS